MQAIIGHNSLSCKRYAVCSSRYQQFHHSLSVYRHAIRGRVQQIQAKKTRTTGNETVDKAIEVGKGFVDSAADFVPDSVPRPVAKGGVAVAGVLVAFWVLQKLVSTVLTIALLGGAAWFYFQYGGKDDSGGSSGGRRDRDVGADPSDPLSEARRIMDKYK